MSLLPNCHDTGLTAQSLHSIAGSVVRQLCGEDKELAVIMFGCIDDWLRRKIDYYLAYAASEQVESQPESAAVQKTYATACEAVRQAYQQLFGPP